MKSTGKLEIISNKDLIREINALYSLAARTGSLEAEWGGFNLRYRALVNEVVDDGLRVEILRGLDLSEVAKRIDHPVDIRPYVETLRDIHNNRAVGRAHHEDLNASIDEIILMISSELASLSS